MSIDEQCNMQCFYCHAEIELSAYRKNVALDAGYYSFIAIRGQQGQFPFYITQCPIRLVSRIFLFDEVDVPLTLRRNRAVDSDRVDALVHYVTDHVEDYTLTPLVAVADCDITFAPLSSDFSEVGHVQVPLTARLIIHDGQHRRAAIMQLVAKDTISGDDSISVMLIPDPQLSRSARIYAALNQTSTSRSLSKQVLHDHADLAVLVRQLVDEVQLFQGITELEKTTISNRSTALFTLSAIYQATQALLGVGKRGDVDVEQFAIAQAFWQELGQIIPQWQQIINKQVTPSYLRQNYVHSHTVTLVAIGIAGHNLIETYPQNWQERLQLLGEIDWSRANTALWEGRSIIRGRMSKANDSIKLTAIAIKRGLGLQPSDQEQALEQRLLESK